MSGLVFQLRLLLLILLGVAQSPAAVLNVSENQVWKNCRVGYDAWNGVNAEYDASKKPSSVYDATARHHTGNKEKASEANRTFFGRFAGLLAAET